MYLQGFVAGIEAGDGSKLRDKRIWCFPEGATVNQGRLIVEKHMRDYPQTLHQDAAMIVAAALMFAFPCRDSN
jgi:Ssp1 endopeptidase immunity protein Rap1a